MNIYKEEIASLIERVRGLKGADREVDVLIWLATTEGATRKATTVSSALGLWDPYVIDETRDASGRLIDAPHYTGSVDAALALVERVQPSLVIKMTRIGDGSNLIQINEAWIGESGIEVVNDFYPFEPMPAAKAVVLSLLLSLQSQEPTP